MGDYTKGTLSEPQMLTTKIKCLAFDPTIPKESVAATV